MTQNDPTAAFAQFNIQLTTAEAATAFVEAMGPYMSLFMNQGTQASADAAARRSSSRAVASHAEGYSDKELRDVAREVEKEIGKPLVDQGGEPWPQKGRLPKGWREYLTKLKDERALRAAGLPVPSEEPIDAAVVDDDEVAAEVQPTKAKVRRGLGVRK